MGRPHAGLIVATGAAAALGALAVWQPWVRTPAPRAADQPSARPLDLREGHNRVTVIQRQTASVPGSSGRLQVHLGDITRGQVEVTLSRADGGGVLPTQSVREGDTVRFAYEGHAYRFRMVRLKNRLLGDDEAELEFSEDALSREEARAVIASLLAKVRASDVVFIRNGVEHSPAEAAEHLEGKWRGAGEEVATPEDFIRICASRSSWSGQPYTVRRGDGTVVSSEAWLTATLQSLRGGR